MKNVLPNIWHIGMIFKMESEQNIEKSAYMQKMLKKIFTPICHEIIFRLIPENLVSCNRAITNWR